MRSRLCRVCRDFHDVDGAWPQACYGHFGVIADAAPMIRPDGMGDTHCPADGKTYDSKSRYYAAVKASGCEIVGNDSAWREPTRPKAPKIDWGSAINETWNKLHG